MGRGEGRKMGSQVWEGSGFRRRMMDRREGWILRDETRSRRQGRRMRRKKWNESAPFLPAA